MENDCVFTLRTSGTEPKVKYYSEYSDKSAQIAQDKLNGFVEKMLRELLLDLK